MGYETKHDAPDVEERIHASYRDWNQWTLLSYNWQIEAFCFADLVEFLMPQLSTLQCPELPADFSIPGGIVAGHFRTFGGLGVSLSGVTLVRHGHDIAGWWCPLCPLCQHGSCCLLWNYGGISDFVKHLYTQLTLDGKPCNPSSSAQEAHPLWSIAFCKITISKDININAWNQHSFRNVSNSTQESQPPQLKHPKVEIWSMFWTFWRSLWPENLEKSGWKWMIPDHRSRFHWRPPVAAPTVTYAPVEVGDVEMLVLMPKESIQISNIYKISRVFNECGNIMKHPKNMGTPFFSNIEFNFLLASVGLQMESQVSKWASAADQAVGNNGQITRAHQKELMGSRLFQLVLSFFWDPNLYLSSHRKRQHLETSPEDGTKSFWPVRALRVSNLSGFLEQLINLWCLRSQLFIHCLCRFEVWCIYCFVFFWVFWVHLGACECFAVYIYIIYIYIYIYII